MKFTIALQNELAYINILFLGCSFDLDEEISNCINIDVNNYRNIAIKYGAEIKNYEIWFKENDCKMFLEKFIVPYILFNNIERI